MSSSGASTAIGTGIGFFSVMLIFTLDSASGPDLLDVLIPYIDALSQQASGCAQ